MSQSMNRPHRKPPMPNRDMFQIAMPIVAFAMGLIAGMVIHSLTTRTVMQLSGFDIFILVFPFAFIAFLVGFLVVDNMYKRRT